MLHSRKENRKSDPQPSETTMRKGQRPKRTLAQLTCLGICLAHQKTQPLLRHRTVPCLMSYVKTQNRPLSFPASRISFMLLIIPNCACIDLINTVQIQNQARLPKT